MSCMEYSIQSFIFLIRNSLDEFYCIVSSVIYYEAEFSQIKAVRGARKGSGEGDVKVGGGDLTG